MRGLAVIFSLFLLAGTALSQELSHEVMVPAAGLITAGGIDIDQTVGEAAILFFPADDYDLTQGFQQPRMVYDPDTKPEGTGVKVYPNPVSDDLTIELFGETARMLTVSIINIYGAEIYSTELNFTGPYWYKLKKPVGDLSQGIYLVRVISRDKFVRRTVKIEKM
ncbi:MAG TPA: T9SS type A sorting domain-containing protein [Bacteroidales bacterium]|nr:T9SS type A sorting domain-containing protein [Bacteroidales bacterium]